MSPDEFKYTKHTVPYTIGEGKKKKNERKLSAKPDSTHITRRHSETELFSIEKKFLFMCSQHLNWCEFMWWITNQILKAGVKKSHTYDEQNEKVSFKVLNL